MGKGPIILLLYIAHNYVSIYLVSNSCTGFQMVKNRYTLIKASNELINLVCLNSFCCRVDRLLSQMGQILSSNTYQEDNFNNLCMECISFNLSANVLYNLFLH